MSRLALHGIFFCFALKPSREQTAVDIATVITTHTYFIVFVPFALLLTLTLTLKSFGERGIIGRVVHDGANRGPFVKSEEE